MLSILFMILVCWFGYRLIRRASGYGAWDDLGRLALIRGAILPLNIIGALREFAPDQPDNPAGMTLVGILSLLGFWWLARVIRNRVQEEPEPEVLLPFRPR